MDQLLLNIELSLITYDRQILQVLKHNDLLPKEYKHLLCLVLKGKYLRVLKHQSVRDLLASVAEESSGLKVHDAVLQGCISYRTDDALQKTPLLKVQKQLTSLLLLLVGISLLHLFLQQNWTGPPLTNLHFFSIINDSDHVAKKEDEILLNKFNDDVKSQFENVGEAVTANASHCHLLSAADVCIQESASVYSDCLKTADWWRVRCGWVKQSLFSERVPSFGIVASLKQLEETDLLKTEASLGPTTTTTATTTLSHTARLLFHTEAAHMYDFYYERVLSTGALEKALQLSCLRVHLTGVMGKRTRFQEKELPQLVLKIERTGAERKEEVDGEIEMEVDEENKEDEKKKRTKEGSKRKGQQINDIGLDDDSVMNNMQLTQAPSNPSLSLHEEALILALCNQLRRSKEGQSSVVKEEAMAYINALLKPPKSRCHRYSHCIRAATLLLRCKFEAEGSRYLQRKLSQLEELESWCRREPSQKKPDDDDDDTDDTDDVDDDGDDDDVDSAPERLKWLFSVNLQPRWVIQQELGNTLIGLGLMNSALEVFTRLCDYPQIIACHAALANNHKAEEIIRQQLVVKETPLLWCYLGDVTMEFSCYERAWSLSRERFSRAQKGMALWLMRKKQFEESLPHFEASLDLNPLQVGLWFTFGCACLACAAFDQGAKAFRRCVNLDSDNFQAWNNLATIYIKSNNKPRAFSTLQEAIKWDFENWRIWENLLFVAIDIGEFEEAIRAYHRLIDLKHTYVDVEVLEALTKAVCGDMVGADGMGAGRLKDSLKKLFGRVTSKATNNSEVWRLYAQLTNHVEAGHSLSQPEHEKVLQYLQRSHRTLVQDPHWSRDVASCLNVCQKTFGLTTAYMDYARGMGEADEGNKLKLLSSARLSLQGVLAMAKKRMEDMEEGEELQKLRDLMSQLQEQLCVIKQE